jgi:hypothetical protein
MRPSFIRLAAAVAAASVGRGGDEPAWKRRRDHMTRGRESAAYLNADFDIGNIVLVEHDVVPLLVEPLRGAAPKKAPHLVQHRAPYFRELRPRRHGRYHRYRRRLDGLHGYLDSHDAEPTPQS